MLCLVGLGEDRGEGTEEKTVNKIRKKERM